MKQGVAGERDGAYMHMPEERMVKKEGGLMEFNESLTNLKQESSRQQMVHFSHRRPKMHPDAPTDFRPSRGI